MVHLHLVIDEVKIATALGDCINSCSFGKQIYEYATNQLTRFRPNEGIRMAFIEGFSMAGHD